MAGWNMAYIFSRLKLGCKSAMESWLAEAENGPGQLMV